LKSGVCDRLLALREEKRAEERLIRERCEIGILPGCEPIARLEFDGASACRSPESA
jgi:hypothetical protein